MPTERQEAHAIATMLFLPSLFVLDYLPEPACRVLGVPRERASVHVHDSKLGGEPHPPLKVVQQRPSEVADDFCTVVYRALELMKVLLEVVYPEVVVQRIRQRITSRLIDSWRCHQH